MLKRLVCLALIAVTAGAGEAWAQKPAKKSSRQERGREYHPAPLRSAPMPMLTVVAESEPNDDAASADAVTLGDQGTGVVNPAGDADYWVFSAQAGTNLDIDVDAAAVGSPLDATLELFDTDGVTSLAFNDDFDGLDSRITYPITVTGEYFIAIRAYNTGGGAGQTYTINFNTIVPGPGDPTTVFASGFAGPGGMAFDRDGNLFVAELLANQISRVTPDGTKSVIASNIVFPRGIAVDGFGDLLVASEDGNIYKVSSAGVPSTFLTAIEFPFWIAVAADGGIWVSDFNAQTVRHYDAFGQFQESFDVSDVGGVSFLAFSPAGELHFSNGFANGIYKLVAGQPQLVFPGPQFLEGFAFDVDGNLYVPNERTSRIVLYAGKGTVLEDPFALDVESPVAMAFGRDATGATNARLFVADFNAGAVLEMNPAGVSAPGWPVGVELLIVGPNSLPDGVVGANYSAMLTVTGQATSLTWSVVVGSLPPGISLDPATGALGDFPTEAGTFAFRVRVESDFRIGEKDFSITVTEPTLALSDVVDRVLGVQGVISPEEERYLDLLGNGNGMFDVGDFRAFLEATGVLGSVAALADRALLERLNLGHGQDTGKGAR